MVQKEVKKKKKKTGFDFEDSDKPQKHFAALIYHAEDARERNKGTNRYDPPLTEEGVRQASVTGKFLNEYFKNEKYKFDKVIIECSPYLSCMMTAGHVATALGVDTVTINYRAAEIVQRSSVEENPIKHTEWVKHDCWFENM